MFTRAKICLCMLVKLHEQETNSGKLLVLYTNIKLM
jgi:hypothetical protein